MNCALLRSFNFFFFPPRPDEFLNLLSCQSAGTTHSTKTAGFKKLILSLQFIARTCVCETVLSVVLSIMANNGGHKVTK